MSTTSYHYADGSANVYIIKADYLEYIPVKPEESSTGFYSGGDPKKVPIKPDEFRSLQAMFETAKKKHEIHIPDRIKKKWNAYYILRSGKDNFYYRTRLQGIESY